MARHLLSDGAIATALARLPGWAREGNALVRRYDTRSYRDAADRIGRVVEVAEHQNHHPDLAWSYRTVTFTVTTHDAGGITMADVDLAMEIDGIFVDDRVY